MQPNPGDLFNLVSLLLVFGYIMYIMLRKLGSNRSTDAPILASAALLGGIGLQSLRKGQTAGFNYNLMTNSSGGVMVFVELGHQSNVHVIALGSKSQVDSLVASLQ